MIAHMAYVVCDRCGQPATQPEETAKMARALTPNSWARVVVAGERVDLCPNCKSYA